MGLRFRFYQIVGMFPESIAMYFHLGKCDKMIEHLEFFFTYLNVVDFTIGIGNWEFWLLFLLFLIASS